MTLLLKVAVWFTKLVPTRKLLAPTSRDSLASVALVPVSSQVSARRTAARASTMPKP